jgi:O-antigen/teichoic acid export membrane protein
MALLLRRLELKRRVRMDLMRRIVEMTVTIGLAVWLQSVWALLGGQLAGFAFGSVLSYLVAPFRPRWVLRGSSLRYFLHFGKWVNVTTVLTIAVMSGGEFLVGRMLGAEALGLYQIALTIPLLLGVRAPVVIGQVSLPTYAMLQADRPGTIKAFVFQMKVVGLLLLPASMSLAVFAPALVSILFGPRWTEAVEPMRILSLYAISAGLTGTMASVQYGMNRSDLPMRVALAQSVVYATVIVPMIAEFGLAGAAGALVAAHVIGVLLSVRYTVQLIGGETRAVLVSLSWIFLISGAAGAAMMHMLPNTAVTGARYLLMGCGMAMVYGIYLWKVEYPKLLSLWRREAW